MYSCGLCSKNECSLSLWMMLFSKWKWGQSLSLCQLITEGFYKQLKPKVKQALTSIPPSSAAFSATASRSLRSTFLLCLHGQKHISQQHEHMCIFQGSVKHLCPACFSFQVSWHWPLPLTYIMCVWPCVLLIWDGSFALFTCYLRC